MIARRNACHNRAPFRHTTWIQDGWLEGAIGGQAVHVARMVEIPFRNSRECQYSKDPMGIGSKDPGCEGCCWKAAP